MRKILLLFVLVFIICILAVSCDDGEGLIKLSSLRNDDQLAVTTLGYVNSIYGSGKARTFVGWDPINAYFHDSNTGRIRSDLEISTYLVVYDKLKPAYVKYVESVGPELGAFEKGHYEGVKPRAGLTYVEYSSWRFKDTGKIFAIDVRVVKGEDWARIDSGYKKNSWAKRIVFDPQLRYDLTRAIDIETMSPIGDYDPRTGEVKLPPEEDIEEVIERPVLYTPEVSQFFDEDILTPLFLTISPEMDISFQKSEDGRPKIAFWSGQDNSYFTLYGIGVCNKEEISSSVIDRFVNGREPNGLLLGLDHNLPFIDPDEGWLFEIRCSVDKYGIISGYEVRLLISKEEGKPTSVINVYRSLDEFNSAFSE